MRKRIILLSLDIAIILLATLIAVLLRDNFETRLIQWEGVAPYLKATVVSAVPVLLLFGLDRAIWRLSSMLDYLIVSSAAITIVMLSVGLGFVLNRLDGVSRSLPILQAVLMICGLVGVRVLARLHYDLRNRARAQPKDAMLAGHLIPFENILIVGLGRIAELYVQSVDEFGGGSKRVVGLLGLADRHSGRLIHQHPILGPTDELLPILQDLEVHGVFVDRIVVTLPFAKLPIRSRQALVNLGNTTKIQLDLFAEQFEMAKSHPADGPSSDPADELGPARAAMRASSPQSADTSPLAPGDVVQDGAADQDAVGHVKVLPRVSHYWTLKRALDLLAATILIVALLPIFVLVAILVAVDIGVPLLFWQQRPGVGKQPFRVYKFRTMRGAYDWNGRRVPDDQRSTPIGRLLRRSRMDELPQLFNILTGHMSFVGPRPLLAVDQCGSNETRLLIRPGLTGWAQVNGGRLLSIPDKMALDLWYLQNASASIDCHVIVKTVSMVLFGEHRDQSAVDAAHDLLQRSTIQRPAALPADPITQTGATSADPSNARAFDRENSFDGPKRQVA